MSELTLPVSPATAATVGGWFAALRPRPRTSLAEWALAHARLYDGRRFVPYAYQRAILDAMTDPAVSRITPGLFSSPFADGGTRGTSLIWL